MVPDEGDAPDGITIHDVLAGFRGGRFMTLRPAASKARPKESVAGGRHVHPLLNQHRRQRNNVPR